MRNTFWMTRTDQARCRAAAGWADLGELTACWLEGSLASRPGHQPNTGPDPETLPHVSELAAVNRAGFLTISSQPGAALEVGTDGASFLQRAAVEGLVEDPRVLRRLTTLAHSAGLLTAVHQPVGAGTRHDRRTRRRAQQGIEATLRNGRNQTDFGALLGRRTLAVIWPGCSRAAHAALRRATHVTLVDPEWAPNETLWTVLAEAAGLTSDLCRYCGCSEHSPCAGGCCWVPDPLGPRCSACPPGAAAARQTADPATWAGHTPEQRESR